MNAPEKVTQIKAALALITTAVTSLLGWTGVAVLILVVCMALDYITGTLAAKAHGEWTSAIARGGLWHKAGEVAAVLVAALCDTALRVILSSAAEDVFAEWRGKYFTLLVSCWYIFTELGSILENAEKLGAPVPAVLIKGIRKLKDRAEPFDATVEDEASAQEDSD